MADEAKFTQADIDAAIEKAVGPLKSKLDEVMDEAKEAKRKLRAASEIKPEDLTAAEERADKAEARAKELEKQAKDAMAAAEKATKALEIEQGAARTYALDAEISGAIAAGQVVPALVPGLTALLRQQAKADLVDGKYAVQIGDKPASEYIKTLLDSDDGKAYRAAQANGGGGAPGGSVTTGAKTMTRAQHQQLMVSNPAQANSFVRDGGIVVNDAA